MQLAAITSVYYLQLFIIIIMYIIMYVKLAYQHKAKPEKKL